MKALFCSLFALMAVAHQASAKAYFQSKEEMIHGARVIAVITIKNVRKHQSKETEKAFGKAGQGSVETLIKGDLREHFTIYGDEIGECASCPLEEGRYLAFLRHYGTDWMGSNWHLSLRPIKGDQVEWYKDDENRHDMVATNLKKAIAEIREELASRDRTEKIPKHHFNENAVCWKFEGRTIDGQGGYTAKMRLLNPTDKPVIFRGWSEQKPCYRLQTLKAGKWEEADVEWAGDKDLRSCIIAPGQSAVIEVVTRNELIPVRVGLPYSKAKNGREDQFVWSGEIAK